ncbi:MAG TPA: 50S ribosomal protein L11 methyltransferase [Mesorhizobium sp.]
MTLKINGADIIDVKSFIDENLPLAAVPSLPEIRLHLAHPGSRLKQLEQKGNAAAPYWAYPWPGGVALARYVFDHPETVRGRRVMDLGSGSGLVAIAAAKAGASQVVAAEIDRNAIAALELNLAANGVIAAIIDRDITGDEPAAIDLILVGDLFYERRLAARVTAFLDRCTGEGIEVLVGDIGRKHLPLPRLRPLAEYGVADFGDAKGEAPRRGHVFSFEAG